MRHCSYWDSGCSGLPFRIGKMDSVSGVGVPGAVFELAACNDFTCRGTTDSNGRLTFGVFPCTSYILREISAAVGYAPEDHAYNICVDACGCIFVDGVPTSQLILYNAPGLASFTAVKVNIENGMPLSGAVYTLYMNSSVIASAVSNAAGQITFTNLSTGTYKLVETAPPPGFRTNTEGLTVLVAQDGSVTIMGRPANDFILSDVPLSEFAFRKLDASTGLPIAGATFGLTQNGTAIGTAVSDSDGIVNLGVLAVGTYQLMETIVPPGYQPNTTIYQVVVGTDGTITVDGVPLDEFIVEDISIEVEPGIDINVENLTTGLNYAQAGDVLLYDIVVSNDGTPASVWQSAYATFYLDGSTTLLESSIRINNRAVTPSQYSYDSAANTLTLYLGDITGGSSIHISFQVTMNSNISDINEIVLNATLGSLV